ncbi:putative sulfate exporter family transporter [Natrinema sp. 1APR25-10V2]|uniref:YeiH family protein n=1 Tax=Natrinema sp. 1APR25-10V2 TaxID=2951081 RepID=UPI002875489F|nr:putative sulfate exporter family transporter [Natrinema sp. 1APR25-10V2]MDS0474634.1 putative sulfate exporter family transporter [Natrinema sp. 1APR25-10V2]
MTVRRLLPGVLALCLGAVLARTLALLLGANDLLLAIALGAVTTNVVGVPARLTPGLVTHKLWLGAGIVLMGASISVATVLEVGSRVFLVVIAVALLTLIVVELLARTVFGLSERLSSLLAAGASICGVSAVVAVAGAISAREDQVAYAAATVLLFDAITIVVYPIIGDLLALSGTVFGIWAGVSMFSTGPVVAVGFAHSEVAGQWATMTKLSRNALIGVVALAYASYYARSGAGSRPSVRTLWDEFPKFVLGMLALALVASTDILSATQQASLEHASNWLFLLAFVGLGTEIQLADLRNTGPVPAIVVLLALLVSSVVSLAALLLVF